MARVAGLPLNGGNFKIKTPGRLVGFLSQSEPSFRNPKSFSSVLIFLDLSKVNIFIDIKT
jgi:hypothetical protein